MKLSEVDLLEFGHEIQMVGAVYAGKGTAYLCLFPEDRADLDGEAFLRYGSGQSDEWIRVLEMGPDEWQAFLRQTDVLETEVQARAADGTIQKAVLRKSQRQIDQAVSWRVFRRDSYMCRYCGRDDVPLTVDHLVLWEEGGPSTEQNLVSACRKCNKTRGRTRYGEWLRHGYYLRVSEGLTEEVRRANEALLPTLESVQRVNHVRSR